MQIIRLITLSFLLIIAAMANPFWSDTNQVKAQSLKLLAGNTFYGAATGAAIATGTMGIKNDFEDLRPLRFGVGLGTLAGLGIGAYDLSQSSENDSYYVNGSFNQVDASGLLILLDTFYGAGTGALVGTAITLMSGDKIIDGIRYGAGIGAWGGLAFGITDAFLLSKSSNSFAYNTTSSSNQPSGIIAWDSGKNWQVGIVNPTIAPLRTISNGQINQSFTTNIQMLNVNIDL